MLSGYYERADATDTDGNSIFFHWQASVYSSTASAASAFNDAVSRTKSYAGSNLSCTYIYHVPCFLATYNTTSGDIETYEIVQVHQCIGESADTEPTSDTSASDITNTASTIHVDGERLLASNCRGGAPATVSKPPARTSRPTAAPVGFHGNCFSYRGALWTLNVKTSAVVSAWWTDLQSAYNNNYPVPTGGSVPGATQGQFHQAQVFMNQIHVQLSDDTNHVGLEFDAAAIGQKYGVKSLLAPGPYAWAMNRVYVAMHSLDQAAYEEWKATNTGLSDYHLSQQSLSNAWDALKQLPCR
jgi:hypothetical protein